jgi:lipopolysaccharide/colanic/teichoic acid biosynthesis glycosyltransferase
MPNDTANELKGLINPDVYIRALNGLATPEEAEQARAYLAANFPRHAKLQRRAARRAFLRRLMGHARIGAVLGAVLFALALAVLLILALPVMVLVPVLIRLTSRGPVIYEQTRVGKDGRRFKMYKFRTMRHEVDPSARPTWTTPGDPRITWFGRWLRATHLDEIPQLWNVIRGEMGFVGPRPERPEIFYVIAKVIPKYRRRLEVRPGITGLAQLLLPPADNLESVRNKLIVDIFYIEHRSLWLDVRIVAATPFAIWVGMPPTWLSRLFLLPSRDECRSIATPTTSIAEEGTLGCNFEVP